MVVWARDKSAPNKPRALYARLVQRSHGAVGLELDLGQNRQSALGLLGSSPMRHVVDAGSLVVARGPSRPGAASTVRTAARMVIVLVLFGAVGQSP